MDEDDKKEFPAYWPENPQNVTMADPARIDDRKAILVEERYHKSFMAICGPHLRRKTNKEPGRKLDDMLHEAWLYALEHGWKP